MSPADNRGRSTLSVHAGERSNDVNALDEPVVLSSTFALGTAEEAEAAFRGESSRYVYGRWRNPTVELLEAKVAALEGAEQACATASGMAAVSGVLLAELRSGDHLVAPISCYGETARLLRERLPLFGIQTTFVDAARGADAYREALRPETRLLYVETPANPVLAVTDIAAVVALARERSLPVVVDNTFATPYCQQPLRLGADVVVHSMTKSLGGHGDAIGGVVCASEERVFRVREAVVKSFGGVLAPFNAFLIARGMRTLALRQAHACSSAQRIASFLERHAAVRQVHYPGLVSHPGHELALRQLKAFGSLIAFELKGGIDAARKVLDSVRLISHAVSLGDVRSLLAHPATTTAASMPAEDRRRAGIGDGLLRLSVGIEDTEDLLEDVAHALSA